MGNVHMEATQINYRGGSKKTVADELDSLKSGLTNVRTTATTAYDARITQYNIPDDNKDVTITFTGKVRTRCAAYLLLPAAQASIYPPIVIGFTGEGGYGTPWVAMVSANDINITASSLSVTIPKQGGAWGVHILIDLQPDSEMTYTVSRT